MTDEQRAALEAEIDLINSLINLNYLDGHLRRTLSDVDYGIISLAIQARRMHIRMDDAAASRAVSRWNTQHRKPNELPTRK